MRLFDYRVRHTPRRRLLRRCLCVAFMSFGIAYYVLTTTRTHPLLSTNPAANEAQYAHQQPQLQLSPSRKYLTYLPHSGFHNQRIAFENALVLSFALGRTLLAPPIHLAHKPIRYVAFDTLLRYHEISAKAGLEHCIQVPSYLSRPLECLGYFESSFVPWDWLVNLSAIVEPIHVVQLPNTSQAWFREHFRLRDNDIFTLRDSSPYQFRFLDTDLDSSPQHSRYSQDIQLSELGAIHHPILQIGTLFGTSRLHLKDPVNLAYQRTVRRSMAFANRNLLAVTESIVLALGGHFFGAHIRLRDGYFKSEAERTVKSVWENLLQNVLGFSAGPCRLEGNFSGLPGIDCSEWSCNGNCSEMNRLLPTSPTAEQPECRTPRHHNRNNVFDTPLYAATDLRQPRSHRGLHLLRQTFPCTLFLGDFSQETQKLYSLKGPYDGVTLQPFLLPFIDAMVAAKASVFVGTQGSTFSKFVTNLWHAYHPL